MYIFTTTDQTTDELVGAQLVSEADALRIIGNLWVSRICETAQGTIIVETTGGCFRRFFDPA